MKKKIVIKVHISCDKCRTKAMKLIASAAGVASINVEGEDKDQFVVTGEGIDSVKLVTRLRKDIGAADILNLGEAKKSEEKKKEEKSNEPKIEYIYPWHPNYYPTPHVVVSDGTYGQDPSCSIM